MLDNEKKLTRQNIQTHDPKSLYVHSVGIQRVQTANSAFRQYNGIEPHTARRTSIYSQTPDGVSRDPSKIYHTINPQDQPGFQSSYSGLTPRIKTAPVPIKLKIKENKPHNVGFPDLTDSSLSTRPQTTVKITRPNTRFGKLKTARLSTHIGDSIFEPSFDKNEQKTEPCIYSLLDRGLIPNGADITYDLQLATENDGIKGKKPSTVQGQFHRLFEPIVEKNIIETRPYTTGLFLKPTKPGSLVEEVMESMRDEYGVSFTPLVSSWTLNARREAGKNIPGTPCPSHHEGVANIPDNSWQRFVRPARTPKGVKANHKQFIINRGRVLINSDAYKHFLDLLKDKVHEILIGYVVTALEEFCQLYQIEWAECSFEQLFSIMEAPTVWRPLDKFLILSCFVNREDIEKECATVGRRFRGNKGRIFAATKIQSVWRMFMYRREHVEFVFKLRACERFREKWLIRTKIRKIQMSKEQRMVQKLERHNELQKLLFEHWSAINSEPRVIIHLPSMSMPTSIRPKYEQYKSWEIRQLGRLVDLMDPNVSVVYITMFSTAEIETYFKETTSFSLDLSALIKSKRLFILPLKRPHYVAETVSLSSILLATKQPMLKIANFIKDAQNAYLVPAVCGPAEIDIADMLGIPILGSYDACQTFMNKHSTQKNFIMQCDLPCSPGFNEFTSPFDFYEKVQYLMERNETITRWLFKMDGEIESRGIAYFDVHELKEILKDTDDVVEITKEDLENKKRHYLETKLYQCVRYMRNDLWPTWNYYLKKFLANGGMIEAAAPDNMDSPLREYPVFHGMIEPGLKLRFLSTSTQVFSSSNKPWLSIFPQNTVSYDTIVSTSNVILKELAFRGIIGHVTLEYAAFKDPDTEQIQLWCTSVKPYFNENLIQAYYNQFVSWSASVKQDGRFFFNMNISRKRNLTYIPKAKFIDMQQVVRSGNLENLDNPDFEERVGLYVTRIQHQNFDSLNAKMLSSLVTDSDIRFDTKWKLGTHIPFLEEFNKQSMAMCCFGKSFEDVAETFLQNLIIIERRIRSSFPAYHNFMEMSNYMVYSLSSRRPRSYIHKQVMKDITRLTDLEVILNNHIKLPTDRMIGLVEETKEPEQHLSPISIGLLNAGIPSTLLSNLYDDFGREKLDGAAINNRVGLWARIPPGLKAEDYLVVIEHLAGLDIEDDPEDLATAPDEQNSSEPMSVS